MFASSPKKLDILDIYPVGTVIKITTLSIDPFKIYRAGVGPLIHPVFVLCWCSV